VDERWSSGNFGMSMEWRRPVTEVIGERLWLTVVSRWPR
jgi:peptide/nickel transport system permease protein